MNTEAALLAAICADPEDDTVRLAYADWLDEQTPPQGGVKPYSDRAEFIRVQVALARRPMLMRCGSVSDRWCPECGDCSCRTPEDGLSDSDCPLHSPSSFHAAKDRERELLETVARLDFGARHAVRADGNPVYLDTHRDATRTQQGTIEAEFHRGFVGSITCTAEDWLLRCDEVRRRHPITRVTLTTPLTWNYAGRVGGTRVNLNGSSRVYDIEADLHLGVGGLVVPALLEAEWPNITFTLPT